MSGQVDGLPHQLKRLEEAGHGIRRALVGKAPDFWLERFLATCALPVREPISMSLQRASVVSVFKHHVGFAA